jgi:hypothetical protein
MKTPEGYTAAEARALAEALRCGERPVCPRCGAPLDERSIPPRGDVSYVRERVWLVCPACHGNAVLERRDLG